MFATRTDDWFSWTIQPPLTAAFLGAAYWAAAALFWWTLHRDDPRGVFVALVPVTVIGVLLLVATLIHWDRFHDDLFGWFWRGAYLLLPVALAGGWISLVREAPSSSARHPLPLPLRSLLALQGITMLAIGLYLFAAPESASDLWPWDLTPLTARAAGAFVAGFGASALHAAAANDLPRFDGAAFAYAALGALELLAVALHFGDFTGANVDSVVFVLFVVSVLGAGLYGVASARTLASASSESA